MKPIVALLQLVLFSVTCSRVFSTMEDLDTKEVDLEELKKIYKLIGALAVKKVAIDPVVVMDETVKDKVDDVKMIETTKTEGDRIEVVDPTVDVSMKEVTETKEVSDPVEIVTMKEATETKEVVNPTEKVTEKETTETKKVADPTEKVTEKETTETKKVADPTEKVTVKEKKTEEVKDPGFVAVNEVDKTSGTDAIETDGYSTYKYTECNTWRGCPNDACCVTNGRSSLMSACENSGIAGQRCGAARGEHYMNIYLESIFGNCPCGNGYYCFRLEKEMLRLSHSNKRYNFCMHPDTVKDFNNWSSSFRWSSSSESNSSWRSYASSGPYSSSRSYASSGPYSSSRSRSRTSLGSYSSSHSSSWSGRW